MGKLPDSTTYHIIQIEKSDWTDKEGQTTPGVKLTLTKPVTDPDSGKQYIKVHTTRKTVVQFMQQEDVLKDVNELNDPLGPIRCVKPVGKNYYLVEDAEPVQPVQATA